MERREFLKIMAGSTLATPMAVPGGAAAAPESKGSNKMKLGLVTYNFAADWDLPTIIQRCSATGYEAVELRTTHAHGVEPSMPLAQRKTVKKQFDGSPVVLWALGSICEFHSPDSAVVQKNIETCRQFCELAKDVGAKGVKVRPNALPEGVPHEKTLEQIGKALRECGKAGQDNGVEIFVEVHGTGTQNPPNMKAIIDHCGHPNVGINWNCNPTDVLHGSVNEYFHLLQPHLRTCHINELVNDYPWRELFTLLKGSGYNRYTLAEIQGLTSKDPKDIERFMRFYRALWMGLTD